MFANSGYSISGGIAGPPSRTIVAPWCNELHHSTEKLMIGMLIAPTIARTALALSAFSGSSIAALSAIYPK